MYRARAARPPAAAVVAAAPMAGPVYATAPMSQAQMGLGRSYEAGDITINVSVTLDGKGALGG